jgi:hypothetical protein
MICTKIASAFTQLASGRETTNLPAEQRLGRAHGFPESVLILECRRVAWQGTSEHYIGLGSLH